MTRTRPMSKAERAAMADALRDMNRGGVAYRDLVKLAGVRATDRAKTTAMPRRPA